MAEGQVPPVVSQILPKARREDLFASCRVEHAKKKSLKCEWRLRCTIGEISEAHQ